jgi:hypothetical protein
MQKQKQLAELFILQRIEGGCDWEDKLGTKGLDHALQLLIQASLQRNTKGGERGRE